MRFELDQWPALREVYPSFHVGELAEFRRDWFNSPQHRGLSEQRADKGIEQMVAGGNAGSLVFVERKPDAEAVAIPSTS